MTTDVSPPTSVAGRVSEYARGSVANMVRSLVLVVAMMAVLFFAVARVNTVSTPDIDVNGLATQVARETGWPIEVPEGLPDGWAPSQVRYLRSTGGLLTWHVGYTTPKGDYVAVQQTKDGTAEWIRAQTNRAAKVGTMDIGGAVWDKYVRDQKVQNSLVLEQVPSGGLSTLITGTGSFDDLALFAAHLRPFHG